MERRGWRAWGRAPGLAAGLLLIERELLDVVGMPNEQLRALQLLGRPSAEPVAPVIAGLAVLAETLVGYLLMLLILQSLSLLPGSIGQLTGRVALLASPRMLHRLLDLLVGGALLAQATLATMPGSSPGRGPGAVRYSHMTVPAPSASVGPIGAARGSGLISAHLPAPRFDPPVPVAGTPAGGPPAATTGPAGARPTLSRLAAPLPPWLGGGPSNTAPRYTVKEGDTLWDIAASHLAPADRSSPKVDRYWQRIYRFNRPVIGVDPDLIHPGTRLDVPPSGDDRP